MEKTNGNGHPKSFSRFHARDVKNLGITIRHKPLFPSIQAIQPSAWLTTTLDTPPAFKLDAEKAKSEFIIAPIISETVRRNAHKLAVFSGYAFEVDADKGLTGTCDYILTADPEATSIEAPVFFIVEAKNENLMTGEPQCIAELFAAQIFNTQASLPAKPIYGVVTFGREWQFYRLDDKIATRDTVVYQITQLPEILGILQAIVDISGV